MSLLRIMWWLPGVAGFLACASPAPQVDLLHSGAWGHLALVPRAEVDRTSGGAGGYGDRRLSDVTYVDYSRPGFAVVYTSGQPRASAPVVLEIRDGRVRTSLSPEFAAQSVGREVVIENRSAQDHTVSCPRSGFVARVVAGASVRLSLDGPGEYEVYVLDAPGAATRVFAAPGPFAIVSGSGRSELTNLTPGRRELHVWHPRFPPVSSWADLEPGRVVEIDFALGAGDPARVGEW